MGKSKPKAEEKKSGENRSPYLSAFFLSKLTFWWLGDLFRKAVKAPLREHDIYDALPQDRAERCIAEYDTTYERLHKKNPKKKPSLWMVFRAMYKGTIMATAVLVIFWESVKIFQPVMVGWLVIYFQSLSVEIPEVSDSNVTTMSMTVPTINITQAPESPLSPTDVRLTTNQAYIVGAALALSSFINSLPGSWYFALQQNVATRLRAICCALIFRKSLRLSNSAMAGISTGRIVNLMSTDVEKFHNGLLFLHFYWVAPLEVIAICTLLYTEVGVHMFAGVAFIALVVPTQLLLGKAFGYLRLKTANLTDQRILKMSEVLSGMRVIKMYCWEKSFGKIVSTIRRSEMGVVMTGINIKCITTAVAIISPKIVTALMVTSYVLSGETLTAAKVVKVISWSELLRMGVFTFLSFAAQFGTEMFKSVQRIEEFLDAEELEEQRTIRNTKPPSHIVTDDSLSIAMYGINANWIGCGPKTITPVDDDDPVYCAESGDGFSLDKISVKVKKGQLVAFVGPVGSGKSSMLLTMLGEMPICDGYSNIQGNIVYTPQESWVFAGTVRENILFGLAYDKRHYEQVLTACALTRDLELMQPLGDQTLVGEKGFSLSGGQKARINLARAVYRNVDIYLMDDPLSAVDSKVGRHIFQKCICGELKDKTRILVTHQIQFLKDVDYIYIMKDGAIISEGTYDMISEGLDLMKVMTEVPEQDPGLSAAPVINRQISNIRSSSVKYSRENSVDNSSSHSPDNEKAFLTMDVRTPVGTPVLGPRSSFRQSKRRRSSIKSIKSGSVLGVEESEAIQDFETMGPPPEGEDIVTGSVSLGVFAKYFGAGYGVILWPLFMFLAVTGQVCYNMADILLSGWTSEQYGKGDQRLWIYLGVVGGMILSACCRSLTYSYMSSYASINLHKKMFNTILRAPMSFFDKNPTGRILNRFSRDTGFMDDILVQTFHQVWVFLIMFLGIVVFVTITIWYTIFVTLPLIVAIMILRWYATKAIRDVKRVEATVRSPVYSHLSATLSGLPVIRAFHMQDNFKTIFHDHQDRHTSGWYIYMCTARWFGLRLDWLVATYFAGCIAAAFVITSIGTDVLDGGQIGLCLSYISAMLGVFQFIMRQTAEVESYMTSVERVQQYTTIDREGAEHTDVIPPASWPQKGEIKFDKMSLSYSQDENFVLKDIKLDISGMHKIGIVGRTGAGKSSLISCLFRLAEPKGSIWMDSHDITKLGLTDIRKKISIIPQEPVLFTGTLRYNLDPLDEYADDHLWQSLESVHLGDKIRQSSGGLDLEMLESGGNFSVGQRQLICLARAILKNNKVLVIDEATANVDQSTDKLIQKTIRQKFKDCTVLCIAHRLNTIIDYDKVLVLDGGEVMQYDHAHVLLKQGSGIFHEMVQQTGAGNAQLLHHLARQSFESKSFGDLDEEEDPDEDNRKSCISLDSVSSMGISTGFIDNLGSTGINTNTAAQDNMAFEDVQLEEEVGNTYL